MSEVTLAVLDANIITLNPKQLQVEAMAVQNGRIVAVGSNEKVRKLIGGKTEVINGRGRTVVPGFVDCHVHMTGFGLFLRNLDLRNVQSIKDLQKRLREYAVKNSEKGWILGGRWDQEKFAEKRYPARWDLDAAVPERAILLTRVCGHIGVANSKALQFAGITGKTNVKGGKVDLDEATGEPNGIVRENALGLVVEAIPKLGLKDLEEACLLACEKAVESGLTEVHLMVDSADEMRAIQNLNHAGKLPLRVYLGISVRLLSDLVSLGLLTGFGDDMLRIGFVKILADGSLGARTAALKKPYADEPETCGMMLYTQRELDLLVLKAHEAGLQLAVHAIGDRAADVVMQAFEKALKKFPREDHRHRIEHCSVMGPELITRMKRLSLIASVQPHFVVSDFWAQQRVGKERAGWVYPFRMFMNEGLVVVSGSDCPVENISPLLGIWAAVAKISQEKSLKVDEALKTYTVNAAYASFGERKKGTLEVGKFADFTILSEDLLKVEPNQIKNVSVVMTVVNGKVVYERKGQLS
jgi:predicted amidohydrolase YtcJ